jgi:hypothetical protein
MSTSAVSINLVNQQSEGYFHQRRADLQQLSQDLQSGNLSAAQQDYATLQSLAQSSPFGGNAFYTSQRQQDFAAIGQALQAGDVNGAQQAFAQLQGTFLHGGASPVNPGTIDKVFPNGTPASPVPGGINPGTISKVLPNGTPASPVTGGGSEIVLNLGTLTPGEQINININNGTNGTDQISVGVANQGQTPEQITFNLNPNSNEQVVLNLLNNASASSSSSTNGNGVSVTA